jgi:hypothetical protein
VKKPLLGAFSFLGTNENVLEFPFDRLHTFLCYFLLAQKVCGKISAGPGFNSFGVNTSSRTKGQL